MPQVRTVPGTAQQTLMRREPVMSRIDRFPTVTLREEGSVFCGDRWQTRWHDGSRWRRGPECPAGVAVGCGAVVRRHAARLCRAGRPGAEGTGVRCFYDAEEQVRLWGTHLAEDLPRIYAHESAAVVVFVSADYAGQAWTRLERRAALARAVIQAGVYVLPARSTTANCLGCCPMSWPWTCVATPRGSSLTWS